jgi:hypothetical protein
MEKQILKMIKDHFYNVDGTPETSAKEITTHVMKFAKWVVMKEHFNDLDVAKPNVIEEAYNHWFFLNNSKNK